MSARLALHWVAVAATAVVLSTLASLPFTEITAGLISALATAGVGLVGLALAPTCTRKDSPS